MSDNANKPSEPAKKPHRTRPLRRDRPGVNAAALFLRLALGVTFLWAGVAKLMGDLEVSGESARILHEMGVIGPPGGVTLAPSNSGAAPAPGPSEQPASPQRETEPAPEPAPQNPAQPEPAPSDPPLSTETGALRGSADTGSLAGSVRLVSRQTPQTPALTAEDFSTPVKVRLVHGITIAVYKAAAGTPTNSGGVQRLLPAGAGKRPWPVAMAYAVMATEIIGGFFVLIGFLTRLSALGLAGTMAGALWLTQIGPAMASGTAWLGVIPDHPNFGFTGAGPPAYTTLLWQVALLASSLAVVMLGAGAASVDRLLRLGR